MKQNWLWIIIAIYYNHQNNKNILLTKNLIIQAHNISAEIRLTINNHK